MTSKELFIHCVEQRDGIFLEREKRQIIEDLEILEILKKHCDFSLWDDYLNILAKEEYSIDYESGEYTSVSIPNEEDRKAINEWLEKSDN